MVEVEPDKDSSQFKLDWFLPNRLVYVKSAEVRKFFDPPKYTNLDALRDASVKLKEEGYEIRSIASYSAQGQPEIDSGSTSGFVVVVEKTE